MDDAALQHLEKLVGAEAVTTGDETAQYTVDGLCPCAVVRPASAEELKGVLALAAEHGLAVTPWGGGTQMGMGNPPGELDLVIHTARLDQITDYEPADMTVTVQGGASFEAFSRVLDEHGQFLPLDQPEAARPSIGGLVATAASGPRRLQYGAMRDLVMGVKVVTPAGEEIKSGGRVVKNATGYDLCKLFTGSLGSLGVITEVSFKLFPQPPCYGVVMGLAEDAPAVAEAVGALRRTDLRPSALEYVDRAACAASPRAGSPLAQVTGAAVLALFTGIEAEVRYQIQEAERVIREAGLTAVHTFAHEESRTLWSEFSSLPWHLQQRAGVCARVSFPPARLADFTRLCGPGESAGVLGRAGNGVLYLYLPGENGAAAKIQALRDTVRGWEGHLAILSGPPDLKKEVDAWGPAGGNHFLMKRIKEVFDPRGIMNPGRFVGGL